MNNTKDPDWRNFAHKFFCLFSFTRWESENISNKMWGQWTSMEQDERRKYATMYNLWNSFREETFHLLSMRQIKASPYYALTSLCCYLFWWRTEASIKLVPATPSFRFFDYISILIWLLNRFCDVKSFSFGCYVKQLKSLSLGYRRILCDHR